MKTRIAFLLCLVGCAALPPEGPTNPPPAQAVTPPQAFADSLRSAVPASTRMATLAAPVPLGAQVLTWEQCSATVRGHYAAVQNDDGSWTVQVPQTGAVVVSYASSDGATGATLNLTGHELQDGIPEHEIHRRQLPANTAVQPEDALIVYSAMGGNPRGDYAMVTPGRSQVDQAMPVVFVSWAPSADLLRPPAIGNSALSRFFRTIPVPKSIVDPSRLPRVVDFAALGVANPPPISYCEGIYSRFCGEVYSGWGTDLWTPDHQHPGYGREVASSASLALLHLVSTATPQQKQRLALNVSQWAFDLVGAFADGRWHVVGGGHCGGRKALVVTFGVLTGLEPFANPSAFLGPAFVEDRQWIPRQCWNGWTSSFAYQEGNELDGRGMALPPAQWTASQKWAWQGYCNPCAGTQIGTVLAMRLMGRTDSLSRPLDAFVAGWMSPPAGTAEALAAAGVIAQLRQATNYGWSVPGVQEAAWTRYAGQ